ncbi:MAG: HD domain-containing protein [Deltaproteobacteria bacterium]|nr:HD domain-containing protein [Deltaproteobacteria bacterium]
MVKGSAERSIKRDLLVRTFLRRFGILNTTLIVTLVAILCSFLMYLGIGTIFEEITPVGMIASVIIPFLLAPPLSYAVLRLSQKLGLAEKELLNAYNSLELQVRMRTAELATANRLLQDEIIMHARTEKKLKKGVEKLQKSLEKTIAAIAAVSEIRDPFTAGHQKRVATLAYAIAEEMGLPKSKRDRLHLAAIVHDIGKVQIPTEILIKPLHLSEAEFNIIEAHPQIAHDILYGIEYSRPIAKIVLQHHELLDGSGYPQGLSGDEIILEARILTVADVVEAMASHRPYRPAHGIGKALEEILHNKGKLYDPKVVDACLRVFYEKEFAFE